MASGSVDEYEELNCSEAIMIIGKLKWPHQLCLVHGS
jgi:hypothetical protein